MKLGVMSALFSQMKLEDALDYCQKVGLQAIELPAGAYPGDPWKLNGIAKDKKAVADLKQKIAASTRHAIVLINITFFHGEHSFLIVNFLIGFEIEVAFFDQKLFHGGHSLKVMIDVLYIHIV